MALFKLFKRGPEPPKEEKHGIPAPPPLEFGPKPTLPPLTPEKMPPVMGPPAPIEEPTEEEPERKEPEPVMAETRGPLFVKIDDYKAILHGISVVKNNVDEANNIIKRLGTIRTEKDKEFEKWKSKLEDLNRKLVYIDKTIFEASAGDS